jgi:MinD superfamily P-loop ATPase
MAWLSGYPREQVDWFPTIDPKKCVECGICMNCGKKVFVWTEKGARVAKPYECVVGCSTCANLCQGHAISFQSLDQLRDLYKREGIWAKIKEKMTEEGKLVVSDVDPIGSDSDNTKPRCLCEQ